MTNTSQTWFLLVMPSCQLIWFLKCVLKKSENFISESIILLPRNNLGFEPLGQHSYIRVYFTQF